MRTPVSASLRRPIRRPRISASITLFAALWAASCSAFVQETSATRIEGRSHFIDGYPTEAPDGRLNFVVEAPAGTLAVWQVNEESGILEWVEEDGVPRAVQFLAYPANFGVIPQTLRESRRDKDDVALSRAPLAALALGASARRGSVIRVTPIGVVETREDGFLTRTILTVTRSSPFERVQSVEDLDARFPGVTDVLSGWLSNHRGRGATEVLGFDGPERAAELIDESHQRHRAWAAIPGSPADDVTR